MTQFVATDSTGRVAFGVGRPDPEDFTGTPGLRPMPRDGFVFRAWQGRLDFSPPTPTSEYRWVDNAPKWIDVATLEQARVHAWAAAKAARDAAEAAPFEFEGRLYDPSKENISGAALAALLAQLAGQEIADEWTLADNTRVTLNGPQIIALGQALTQHVKRIHAHGRVMRDLINSAATPEEALGYTWSMNDE